MTAPRACPDAQLKAALDRTTHIVLDPEDPTRLRGSRLASGGLRLGQEVKPHRWEGKLSRVPREDRRVQVYCDRHDGKRRLVAVVTRQQRLYTSVENIDWLRWDDPVVREIMDERLDDVLAPCDDCLDVVIGYNSQGRPVRLGTRSLSIPALRTAVGARHFTAVTLDSVLDRRSLVIKRAAS